MPEKVSIIIATYNRPDMLGNALNSILKQTFEDWKVYVVNDGGVDVSAVVISLIPAGKFAYWNSLQNIGSYAALNKGIAECKGEFIIFLDDDDMFFPNALKDMDAGFTDDKICGVYAKCERYHNYKNPFWKELIPKGEVNLTRAKILERNWVPISAWMVRGDFLRERNGFDLQLKFLADYDLLCEIALFHKMQYVNSIVSKVIMHPESRSIKRQTDQSHYRPVVQKKYLRLLKGSK